MALHLNVRTGQTVRVDLSAHGLPAIRFTLREKKGRMARIEVVADPSVGVDVESSVSVKAHPVKA